MIQDVQDRGAGPCSLAGLPCLHRPLLPCRVPWPARWAYWGVTLNQFRGPPSRTEWAGLRGTGSVRAHPRPSSMGVLACSVCPWASRETTAARPSRGAPDGNSGADAGTARERRPPGPIIASNPAPNRQPSHGRTSDGRESEACGWLTRPGGWLQRRRLFGPMLCLNQGDEETFILTLNTFRRARYGPRGAAMAAWGPPCPWVRQLY